MRDCIRGGKLLLPVIKSVYALLPLGAQVPCNVL
jgi:hypothetical protein